MMKRAKKATPSSMSQALQFIRLQSEFNTMEVTESWLLNHLRTIRVKQSSLSSNLWMTLSNAGVKLIAKKQLLMN